MRVYAYKVQQMGNRSLPKIAELIHERELSDRSFGSDFTLRLEEFVEDGDFLKLDFAKRRRGHGPGRYAANQRLSAFPLGEGEGFGEDTAMVYHKPTQTLAVQYNHHGPKMNAIHDYFFAADLRFGIGPAVPGVADGDRTGLRFGAVLTANAINKLHGVGFYRTIDFAIAVPAVREEDKQAGLSFAGALKRSLPGGVESIAMTIGATTKKDSSLDPGTAASFINGLLSMGMALKRATVSVKHDIDDKVDEVDLVEERVKRDIDLPIGPGDRYPTAARWDTLKDAWTGWFDAGLLPT